MLTERDRSLLLGLTQGVKFLEIEQVIRGFFVGASTSRCLQRLRELEQAGWVSNRRVMARPGIRLGDSPAYSWCPGQPQLAPVLAGKLSYFFQSRWKKLALKPTFVVSATANAAARFSGFEGRFKQTDVDHDLVTGEVFLRARATEGIEWLSEALLKVQGPWGRRGVPLPDAAIVDRHGGFTAIESAGSYGKAKLLRYHKRMAANRTAYELF